MIGIKINISKDTKCKQIISAVSCQRFTHNSRNETLQLSALVMDNIFRYICTVLLTRTLPATVCLHLAAFSRLAENCTCFVHLLNNISLTDAANVFL